MLLGVVRGTVNRLKLLIALEFVLLSVSYLGGGVVVLGHLRLFKIQSFTIFMIYLDHLDLYHVALTVRLRFPLVGFLHSLVP